MNPPLPPAHYWRSDVSSPEFGLNETQRDQVYSIYYSQSLKMTDDFSNPEKMQESQLFADEEVREILNEEQHEKFNTIKENQNFGNFTLIARLLKVILFLSR